MRLTRALTLTLWTALLGLPATVVAAGPAAAADVSDTTTTLVRAGTAVYQQTQRLAGTVTIHDATQGDVYVPGTRVTIQRRLAGSTTLQILGTASVGQDGLFRFSTRAVRNAWYYASYAGETFSEVDGTVTFQPSRAATRGTVSRNLHGGSARSRGRIYLTGNVDPGWSRQVVRLQRKTCGSCAWRAYTSQRATTSGGFRFLTRVPRHGSWYYRAVVPGTRDYVTSFSRVLRVYTVYR